MKNKSGSVIGFCSAVAVLCNAGRASAYDYNTHSRIVEEAVLIMQDGPSGSPPAGVTQQEWTDFLSAAQSTPARLGVLKTGLPKSVPTTEENPLLQVAPPADDPPTSAGYPFSDTSLRCQFDPRDNLANVGDFRIEDFHYDAQRSASPCGVIPETTDPGRPMRKVLGWHAADVDNHYQDTVMWYRPTNAGFTGAIKHAVSRALEEGLGALLIPFVCAWEFLSGGSCDPQDAEDLATKADPINYIDSWLPGFGKIYGPDYTGLWHFMDMASSSGQFNDVRGMLYEDAGRDFPGTVDVGIMAFADITGLSLKPSEADGDNNFGKYDRVSRNNFTWQDTTIGHLEWSPLHHLADYGWDIYRSDLTNARGLGWVLHAIGVPVSLTT
jgi:hypothetical protein